MGESTFFFLIFRKFPRNTSFVETCILCNDDNLKINFNFNLTFYDCD